MYLREVTTEKASKQIYALVANVFRSESVKDARTILPTDGSKTLAARGSDINSSGKLLERGSVLGMLRMY